MKPYLPLFFVVLAACGNKTEGATSTTSPSSTAAASASAPSPVSASASAGAAPGAAPAAPGAAEVWKGSARSKVGEVTLHKEAAEAIKVWKKDPGTALIGDCALTLKLGGGKVRAVSGEVTGVLGTLTVSGEVDGDKLQARVDPADPNSADAMTGVLQGTIKEGAVEATLRVSNRNANLVREAEFKLAK